MFERFSDRARHVIVLTQEAARNLDHNYIGTEHLLLGLLAEKQGIAAGALASAGVTVEATLDLLVQEAGRGKKTPSGHIPFTPRAKKALELSLREALQLGHDFIGTEHLLLGLLRVDGGLSATILRRQGVDAGALRTGVLDLLSGSQSDERRRRRRWLNFRSEPGADDVRTTKAADQTLATARTLAGIEAVGSHHLLLATLTDPTSAAATALRGLGIDLDAARQALRDVDLTGTTDELPEQAGRRRMQVRLTDGGLAVEVTDPVLVDQARETLAAFGGPVAEAGVLSGGLDECVSLADVWSALNFSLMDIRRRAGKSAGGAGDMGGTGDAGGGSGAGSVEPPAAGTG